MSESPLPTDRSDGLSSTPPSHQDPVSPHEKTVISKQPQMAVAGPVFSSRIAELAKGLEGQQLDGFALDELVGGGGMGAVFRGRDLSLGRQVAIKVVPNTGNDADSIRRFRVEAQSAAKLDHPNIARVYYVGASENWNYIVFEYIDGINLRDLVAVKGPLALDDSVYYITQIADALEHACSREVVHRDIKPSNVLLTPQGVVKLVDMGLARTTENDKSTDLTASGVTLGTFDYISPEQARDPRQADVRSDLYSLGCTWYYLLTGKPPFPDGTMIQKLLSHGSDRPEDPRLLRSDLSRDVVAILNKLMAKRPQDRYQRPVDLIHDLQILAKLQNLTRSRNQPHAEPHPVMVSMTGVSLIPWTLALVAVVMALLGLEYFDRQASDYPLGPPILVNTKIDSSTASKVPASAGDEENASAANSKLEEELQSIANEPRPTLNLSDDLELSMDSSSTSSPPTSPLVSEAGRLENEPGTERVNSNGKARVESLDDKLRSNAADTLVVRARSLVVEPKRELLQGQFEVESLERAIELANESRSVREIWIATDQLTCAPVTIHRSGLIIRNADGFHPKILFDASRDSATASGRLACWWNVGPNAVQWRGLQFAVNLESLVGKWTLVRGDSTANLQLFDCSMTIENLSRTVEASFFSCQPPFLAGDQEVLQDEGTVSTDPFQIQVESCIFRGQANWLSMPTAMRTEIAWRNGLLAVSDHLLSVGGAVRSSKFPTTIRMDLQRATMICGDSMCKLNLDRNHPYRVVLARTANNCVFWQAPGSSLIEIQGFDSTKSLADYLDLRGEDNAYDEGVTSLVSLYHRDGKVTRYTLGELPTDVVRERSPESIVRWVQPVPPDLPYHLHRPVDYRQRPGTFRPGLIERDLKEMAD